MQDAHEIAGTYGLAAMDAIHVAAAIQIQADELITTGNSDYFHLVRWHFLIVTEEQRGTFQNQNL
jgi:predicted nucleic acid-binding protein